VNITIAGAGVVGCAIACELASRAARVRVLDGRGPGGGATRASAGILAPYIEGHDPILRRLGVRSLGLYDEFLERVRRESREDVEYERRGTLQVALNLDEANCLKRAARALGGARIGHALLDAGEVRRKEPAVTADAVAGLEIPEHGYVAADELTRALAVAAMQHGATFDVGSVTAVEGGDVARVYTAGGAIESDAVIVAAGSWSTSLDGVRAEPDAVKPIRGQLLQLRLPQRPAERIIWGDDCYLVSRRDGVVLAGATVEDVGFDERATSAGVQQLLRGALALMPALRDAAFEEVRVGLRPMTRDELPAIGASSTMPHVFYATGHYRNGVLLAPLTARLLADLVLDGRTDGDLASLRPERLGL
jgi:glycine oxidase